MFGIDSPELLVIAVVALVVIGPKELPGLLRSWGKWMAKMRGMASEFRGHVDEMVRQSELDEVKKQLTERPPASTCSRSIRRRRSRASSRKAWPRARRPSPTPRARSTIRWPSRNRRRRSPQDRRRRRDRDGRAVDDRKSRPPQPSEPRRRSRRNRRPAGSAASASPAVEEKPAKAAAAG